MILPQAATLLALSAWAGLRWHNGAGFRPSLALLLDALVAAWCWAVVSLVADRLLLGAIILAFGALGLAIADDAKFAALRERLAFSDRAELLEVFRHPEMYLPFAGTGIVLAGVAILAALAGLLAWFEPPMLPHWWLAPPLLALLAALFFSLAIPPWRRFLGRLFLGWSPACVPDADIPRFGMMACFVMHATIARHERQGRRAPHLLPAPPLRFAPASGRSVVLVQLESFFDISRLNAFDAALPNLRALQKIAVQSGRLGVPCWGANTIRTEFAALTGIDVDHLGLDRFNPYERFARRPVDSLAWDMRRRGARTLCLHPFDLNFYGRSAVMPKLGFERLLGPSAFPRVAGPGYVSDQAIVERIALELEAAQDADTAGLIFAISIAAHGPWPENGFARSVAQGEIPDGLGAYLRAAAKMDDILPQLQSLAETHDAILAIYGDHQPSLPKAFGAIGFSDPRTDYLLYDPRRNAVLRGLRRDLAAHELRGAILQLLDREMTRAEPAILAG